MKRKARRTGRCKCGKPSESRSTYCRECRNSNMRAYREKQKERIVAMEDRLEELDPQFFDGA